MQQMHERYRPQSWADVVGQDAVVQRLQRLAARAWIGGRAFWLTGPSGSGKTSIARLIAAEVADPLSVSEVDATTLTPAQIVELERALAVFGWGDKSGRAVIVNEAHGLRRPAVRQLLVTLERIPAHATFVFTTTNAGLRAFEDGSEDASPLLSRCISLQLAHDGIAKAFAEHVRLIAQLEQLDGRPFTEYLSLARRCKNNMRAMLQAVEAGVMEPSEQTKRSEP